MAKLAVNEAEAARLALRDVWSQLAPVVDRANAMKSELAGDPARGSDPLVQAYVGWLNAFEQEIAAVQALNDAGERVPVEDLRLARSTAEKLLSTITEAERRVTAQS